MSTVEAKAVAERVRFVFGDVAEKIVKIQEAKLGIRPPTPLRTEDVQRLAEELKDLSARMAGEELSKRIYEEIMNLAEETRKAAAGASGSEGKPKSGATTRRSA